MDVLRILFLTPYVPSPVRVRPYNLIRQLSEKGHAVTVLAACASDREHGDAVALRRHCTRVETVRIPFQQSVWNCARGIARGVPLQALYSYSPAFARRLNAEVEGASTPYDVLHIEHLRAALCGMQVTGLPRVYDSVDCISRLFEKTLQMSATPLSRLMAFVDLNRTRRFEGNLAGRFERILMASASDKASLAALGRQFDGANAHGASDSISVVPNGVDLEYFAPHDAPRAPATVVFVGRMSYHANVAAVLYMVRQVLPLVWAQRPEVKLDIVGQDPSREVRTLGDGSGGRVSVTGTVPDTRPYVLRATAAVSPLRYAVGVPNKILEAMAMGTPVITTPVGVASLGARPDEHLLVGRDPAELARQVLRLLGDQDLQRRLAAAGRRYVESHHDWKTIVAQLESIYVDSIAQFRARTLVSR